MEKQEIKDLLHVIQNDLEKLKDMDVDVLFMASIGERGVISGSMEGIIALLLFNMIRYPQFRLIIELAMANYPSFEAKAGEAIRSEAPTHEIIDNYGHDFENMVIEKKKE